MPLMGKTVQFDPLPEGVHKAVCWLVCDIGTREDKRFGKKKHEVVIGWELPECLGKNKRPRTFSRRYSLSMGVHPVNKKPSNLRRDLGSWRGKAFTDEEANNFDILKLLCVSAQIQLIHRPEDRRVEMSAILPCKEKFKPTLEPIGFSLSDGLEIPDALPDWIKQELETCEELNKPEGIVDEEGDGIPMEFTGDKPNEEDLERLPF